MTRRISLEEADPRWRHKDLESDEKSAIIREMEALAKGRRYISHPSEAPDGVQVQEGERGGFFYETDVTGSDTGQELNTPEPSDFTPAETVEEAKAFARENILWSDEEAEDRLGEKELDYGDLDIDTINEINRGVYRFTQHDHLPNLMRLKYDPEARDGVDAFADANGITIVTTRSAEEYESTHAKFIERFQTGKIDSVKGDIDYLVGNIQDMKRRAEDEDDPDRRERMQENVERYREQLEDRREELRELRNSDADRSHATPTIEDVMIHEYAHVIDANFTPESIFHETIRNNVFRGSGNRNDAFKPHGKKHARQISHYATTNVSEYIAESLTAYMNGETDRLEDEVIEFWDSMMERGTAEEWGDLTRWER